MSGFLARHVFLSLILIGWALPSFAQNPAEIPESVSEEEIGNALSLPPSASEAKVDVDQLAPVLLPVFVINAAAPSQAPVAAPAIPKTIPATSPSVETIPLDQWEGTTPAVAERLLSILTPSSSAILNSLTRRLLASAEDEGAFAQKLASARAEKLALFGDAAAAWALIRQADTKHVSDKAVHLITENALVYQDKKLCNRAPQLAVEHPGADWQEILIVCQLRDKNIEQARLALDVLRSQKNANGQFLSLADKNVLNKGKTLPSRLTLTPTVLALLQMTNVPLPDSVYMQAPYSLAPALVSIPAQQEGVRLAWAERGFERGLISSTDLETVYRSISFSLSALQSPLDAKESGERLRALLFQATEREEAPTQKIAYMVKLARSASPAFINRAGAMIALLLGEIKPDPAQADNALLLARIYMQAGDDEAALEWLEFARGGADRASDIDALWPQLVLAGLQSESSFTSDLDKWVAGQLKKTDERDLREVIAPTLLLLDAAGKRIPDTVWAKILTSAPDEKMPAFSSLLLGRMQAAAAGDRRAETVLLAVALAGEGNLAPAVAVGITAALRQVGFETEAALFAREAMALLRKAN